MPFSSPRMELFFQINMPDLHKRWVQKYGHAPGYVKYTRLMRRRRKKKRSRRRVKR